ncbi:MAG: YitT family protein [Lachnospiraceae bacterium]|nr:YitT family protein [Lachnospiraceae bacterium]MBR4061264.1 YitT family protein [Lachnospiraceae bacterium]
MKHCVKLVYEYGIMTVGAVIYAMGIALFLDPNHLAPGGLTGIAIILNQFLPLETGTIIFLFNVPLIILGYLKLGRTLIFRTFYCVVVTTTLIDSINSVYGRAITDDLIISAIAGCGMVGIGIGLIMKQGSTTGGSDIIVRLLRKKFPHIKTSALFSVFDYTVVAISAIVFKDIVLALYALIAVTVSAYVLDKVLYGTDEAKLLYIISDRSQPITEKLLKDLAVGVTFIQGKGAYSGKEKDVIMVAMRKALAPKAEEIVKEVDPTAFMIITSASEVYGQGHKNIFSEKL